MSNYQKESKVVAI